jgi:hypothetical protein
LISFSLPSFRPLPSPCLSLSSPHFLVVPPSPRSLDPHFHTEQKATELSPQSFHHHVNKRPLRWLDVWRGDTQKCSPSCIKPPQWPLTPRFSFPFPTFTPHHISHLIATMKWLVARTRALASALVHATSCFGVCLFMFVLFLGDLPPCASHFRRVRCSHCTRVSRGMPRFSSVILGVTEAFRAAF